MSSDESLKTVVARFNRFFRVLANVFDRSVRFSLLAVSEPMLLDPVNKFLSPATESGRCAGRRNDDGFFSIVMSSLLNAFCAA